MANFVIIVDGEVAGNIPIPELTQASKEIQNSMQGLIAALSSDPTIVPHDIVPIGYIWDGKKFTPPVE